jgi:hypothetical protein
MSLNGIKNSYEDLYSDSNLLIWKNIPFNPSMVTSAESEEVEKKAAEPKTKEKNPGEGVSKKRKLLVKVWKLENFFNQSGDQKSEFPSPVEVDNEIQALKIEIAQLREKKRGFKSKDAETAREKRLEINTIDAAVLRKSKRLQLLEKQQLIYKLESEKQALIEKNESLEKDVQQLKAKLEVYEQWEEQPDVQLSITIPQTTMLLSYPSSFNSPQKSPKSSPIKKVAPPSDTKKRFSPLF